jgi:DNA-binding transcriptional MerR regulator
VYGVAVAVKGEWTIDQLAAEVDLPSSTIRLYQNRRLLPPPEKRGRVGFYDQAHLERLRLIEQLQERGYSLAAIKDLIDRWQEGGSLGGVLGLTGPGASSDASEAIRLTPAELAEHFQGIELRPEDVLRSQQLGLLEVDGDHLVVPSPEFLEVGSALARLGVPQSEILDEYEHLRDVAGDLADRFTSLFERNLWKPFVERGLPAAEVPELTETLARLGPLAQRIVQGTLQRSLEAKAEQFLLLPGKSHGRTVVRTGASRWL